MRVVIQRVLQAQVEVNSQSVGRIDKSFFGEYMHVTSMVDSSVACLGGK